MDPISFDLPAEMNVNATRIAKRCMSPNNHDRDLLRYPVLLKDMGSSNMYHPDPVATRCMVPWEWTLDIQKADALLYNTLEYNPSLPLIVRKCQKRVLVSVESPLYHGIMLLSKEKGFDIDMNFRLDSDIPIPYVPPSHLNFIKKIPVPTYLKRRDVFITAFISNCFALNNRLIYMIQLMEYVNVHSYGKCEKNVELPSLSPGQGWVGQKSEIISKYKFTLAFENSNFHDYVTEKFFHPLLEGSVPVYMGADNIDDFAPNSKAVIKVTDFSSPKELADYLIYLHNNDTAYEEHLAWKFDRSTWSDRFLRTLDIGRMDGHCRLAMYLAGKYKNPLTSLG